MFFLKIVSTDVSVFMVIFIFMYIFVKIFISESMIMYMQIVHARVHFLAMHTHALAQVHVHDTNMDMIRATGTDMGTNADMET
jgi:hypothetical protein